MISRTNNDLREDVWTAHEQLTAASEGALMWSTVTSMSIPAHDSRLSRIYTSGSTNGRVNKDVETEDWSIMGRHWANSSGLDDNEPANVRLGMRGDPTASDWRQLWDAVAEEHVVKGDVLARRDA